MKLPVRILHRPSVLKQTVYRNVKSLSVIRSLLIRWNIRFHFSRNAAFQTCHLLTSAKKFCDSYAVLSNYSKYPSKWLTLATEVSTFSLFPANRPSKILHFATVAKNTVQKCFTPIKPPTRVKYFSVVVKMIDLHRCEFYSTINLPVLSIKKSKRNKTETNGNSGLSFQHNFSKVHLRIISFGTRRSRCDSYADVVTLTSLESWKGLNRITSFVSGGVITRDKLPVEIFPRISGTKWRRNKVNSWLEFESSLETETILHPSNLPQEFTTEPTLQLN